MAKRWNQQEHKPVVDPQRAGGPSTTGNPSGDGRANVVPAPLSSDGQPRPKAPAKP